MTTTPHQVLKLLAGGECLSGEAIGRRLGVSRMAVSKAVRRLRACDIDISAVTGRGYTLRQPVQLLDREFMLNELNRRGRGDISLHILASTGSTSDYLLGLDAGDIGGSVCLAERQQSGRGRRERGWVATPYRNLTLSMGWRFEHGMGDLGGLGVAAGIAIVNALHEQGFNREIGLKWPNDIVWQGRKLGGMLIDVRGEHDGLCIAVLGLGLNLSLSEADAAAIDQPWATLNGIEGREVDRNALAVGLIDALAGMFSDYADAGFRQWHARWPDYDRLYNEPVVVHRGDERLPGIARGIDVQGALLVRLRDGELGRFFSAEVSLRRP